GREDRRLLADRADRREARGRRPGRAGAPTVHEHRAEGRGRRTRDCRRERAGPRAERVPRGDLVQRPGAVAGRKADRGDVRRREQRPAPRSAEPGARHRAHDRRTQLERRLLAGWPPGRLSAGAERLHRPVRDGPRRGAERRPAQATGEAHTRRGPGRREPSGVGALVARELDGVALFRTVSDEARRALVERGQVRTFAAGETLMRQGDPSDTMQVILSGRVRVERAGEGREGPLVLAELGPNEIVGEVGILDGGARTATVTALAPTRTLELHRTVIAV